MGLTVFPVKTFPFMYLNSVSSTSSTFDNTESNCAPIVNLKYLGLLTGGPDTARVLVGLNSPVLKNSPIIATSSGLSTHTVSPEFIGSKWWIWTPTFPLGCGPLKKLTLKSPSSDAKSSCELFRPKNKFPEANFLKLKVHIWNGVSDHLK